MITRLAKLFALTTSIPFAGFAANIPDTAIHEDGVTARSVLLNSSRLVSNAELSEMRGGFFTAAGAQFDFGASIKTLVNGKLALQTNLQWTPAGAVTQQLQGLGSSIQAQVASNLAKAGIATPGAAMQANSAVVTDSPITNALATSMPATDTANSTPTSSGSVSSTPAAPAATTSSTALAANPPAASAPAASTSIPPSTSVPASAPATTLASVPASASVVAPVSAPTAGDAAPMVLTGIQIPGATGGSTQVFANIGAGQIQNVILNSASGQDIVQNTNVTLTIYNFAAWQQQVAQHMLSARLANDMLAASGLSAGH
jgi:hypothetical protein